LQQVITHLFQYMALLRQEGGVSEARWADNAALKRLAFDFRDDPSASSYTQLLASEMHEGRGQHLLEAAYHVPLRCDLAATRAVLDCLTPAAALLMVASKRLEGDAGDAWQTEEWYQQRYRISALPREWLDRCGVKRRLLGRNCGAPVAHRHRARSWECPGESAELRLPDVNPFTPTNLALLDAAPAMREPQRLVHEPLLSLWYKTHLEFRAPKATLRLRFVLPGAFTTPAAYMASSLFKALLISELTELSYDAELAGEGCVWVCSHSLRPTPARATSHKLTCAREQGCTTRSACTRARWVACKST